MQSLPSPSASLELIGISPKGAYNLVWHPYFFSCYQGTPLHYLVLVANGDYAHVSHKTATNGERVLKQLQTSGHSKRKHPGAQCFCERGCRFIIIAAYRRAGFYLNTHLKADCKPLQRPWSTATIFTLFLWYAPEHQYLSEGSSCTCLVHQFFISGALFFAAAVLGMPLIIWLWWAGALHSCVPWDCNNQRDSNLQASTPKPLHRQQTEAYPNIPTVFL